MRRPTRRDVLFGAAAAAAWPPASVLGETPVDATRSRGSGVVRVDQRVETTSGWVLGYSRSGVRIFRGIPYATARRFEAPEPVLRWGGIRNALNFGPASIGAEPDGDPASIWRFLTPSGPETSISEDCLNLNVWAPADAGEPRPVMVWLHPGGFERGSSHAYLASDGENLARLRGVVVLSLNHRLGALGFLNLQDVPGAPRSSANAGLLDIVAALRWVRANVERFGGDPANVTVFGQSGGGFKASCLLAMPAATGLLHRVALQSGVRTRVHDPEQSARLAHGVLKSLGYGGGRRALARLQAIPPHALLAAGRAAAATLRAEGPVRSRSVVELHRFEPTAGTSDLPHQPGTAEAIGYSAQVPVICGSTLNEISPSGAHPELESIGWDQLATLLLAEFGPRTVPAIAAARRIHPAWTPADVHSVLLSLGFRRAAVDFGLRRMRAGATGVFSYVFAWHTPLFESRPRAFHTSDIAFVFANTDLASQQTGGGERARRLGEITSRLWATFAAVGDPRQAGLPDWPRFEAERRTTLLLDDSPRAALDWDTELLEVTE